MGDFTFLSNELPDHIQILPIQEVVTVKGFLSYDDDKCWKLFEEILWPDGPFCPRHKGPQKFHKIQPREDSTHPTRPGLYKCEVCHKPFSLTLGTVMEHSPLSPGVWLQAFVLMCSSKKPISALQLAKKLGITNRIARSVVQRAARVRTRIRYSKKLRT